MRFSGARYAGICAIAGFCVVLSACSAPRHKPDPVASVPAQTMTVAPEAPLLQPEPAVAEPPGILDLSPWPRLRSRFVLGSCDIGGNVMGAARQFTRSAGIFNESLRDAMPFLLLVVGELERRDLPGELAFLPYVESRYRPLPGQGRGPAGMWQLMPRTARGQGLQVGKAFDQRLDAIASTRVALDLMERYDREFGDWRVAVMAFNAGEYRVKRQLGNRSAPAMDFAELSKLKLSPTTHQHLNRVMAMACVVEKPELFGVELPAPEESELLEHLDLAPPIDMRVAANLLGLPLQELRRFNAAWRADAARIGPVDNLLVPAPYVTTFKERLQLIPDDRRASWQERRVHAGDSLASLAQTTGDIDALALAMANGLDSAVAPLASSTILVPAGNPVAVSSNQPEIHVVRQGDTLSAIAHRYGVRVGQLLRWNNLDRNSILQLDMQLQLRAPQY